MIRKLLLIAVLLPTFLHAAPVESPSAFLGFTVGEDRKLADYTQIKSYFRHLDANSPRISVQSLGKTTLGDEMIMAVISSEANMTKLPRLREISRKLADPRGLSSSEIDSLVAEGKTIVLVTCNIHSTEIASSQMAMEWAHSLATAEDPETLRRLDNVVLLLVPSLNPDGQTMEVDWYRKHLGTRFEGGRMPWLYHHYVGHDNNRDWFMLTQNETRDLTRALYHEWFPQLFIDEHQMGSTGPRMFIPPFSDPMDPDVHPLIWREVNMIGAAMAHRLEQQNKAGTIYGYQFDAYWIGGTRNTGWWKNITGMLLEVASARMATPIYIDPTELSGGGKGLIEYKAQINHPNPWKGGWWRMRDIMDYERIASDALHEIAASSREDFLRNLVVRAQTAIGEAAPGEAYRIPAGQRDYPTAKRLAELLADHGVEVMTAANGDFWVPLAQPYSRFVREMLEPQTYPEVRLAADAPILQPYDIASWTLPMKMGVEVELTTMPSTSFTKMRAPLTGGAPSAVRAVPSGRTIRLQAGSAANAQIINAALRGGSQVALLTTPDGETPAGTAYISGGDRGGWSTLAADLSSATESVESIPESARPLKAPRVGIYKPWAASMDEGWTRWVLERNGFNVRSVDNKAVRGGKLRQSFDAIILPDIDRDVILTGKPKRDEGQMRYFSELPAEFSGGIDQTGSKALREFVESGGTLIAFNSSSHYIIQEFNVPVRNALARVPAASFAIPGSLVRMKIGAQHPITAGMPESFAGFLDERIAFETTLPGLEMQRWVLATYPEESSDILLSGWMRGEEHLARKAAAVAFTHGSGKIVLFGFRPQHRGQTHATFPLLFNALYWSVQ